MRNLPHWKSLAVSLRYLVKRAKEPQAKQDYEKVGHKHYRKGNGKINFVCLPISNRREGIFVPAAGWQSV